MTDLQSAPHEARTTASPDRMLLSSRGQSQEEASTSDRHGRDAQPPGIDAGVAVIEQAKGALMLLYGISSHEALAVLVNWSQEANTSLLTIASSLLHGICLGDEAECSRNPSLVRWLEDHLRRIPDDVVLEPRRSAGWGAVAPATGPPSGLAG